MFVVAITALASGVESEAPALAVDLGVSAYDARMTLAGGLPAIVLTTPDRDGALELLKRLRSRSHGAVAFDSSAVVSSADMFLMDRFRFDPTGVVVDNPVAAQLPFSDISVLVRATHRGRAETSETVRERSFSAGRAILTGGLLLTKKKSKTLSTTSEEREQVLYVYRQSSEPPWLLREQGTHYAGLGPDAQTSEFKNFLKTVELLRVAAPHADYDESLLTRKIPERFTQFVSDRGGTSTKVASSSATGYDLMAHLLALWLVKQKRQRASPYRRERGIDGR